jgi:hypothetical protein
MKAIKAILCILAGILLGLLLARPRQPAQAALWWFHGVRDRDVSVCFAGNAVTTRAARVREIIGHLQHFEWAANVRFFTVDGTRAVDAAAPGGDVGKLACPAPTFADGKSYYEGDVRVALWSTDVPVDPPGMVPGVGCTQALVGSSWSNPPDELDLKRPCQYNLKLGDDDLDMSTGLHTGVPWLNHTLHEFGHALGLSHEHARADENAGCVPSTIDEYHVASSGYMTPYDKNSVMHYRFWPNEVPSCDQSGSNYSNDGLTAYDRLALHILYPEDNRVAEFIGRTVIRAGETLNLGSAWQARGANLSFVASNFDWKLDGVTRSTTPQLSIELRTPGSHTLQFSYSDFLGRNYSYTGPVRVLDPDDYDAQIVGASAAQLPLLYPNATVPTAGAQLSLDSNVSLAFGTGVFSETVAIDYVPQTSLEGGGLGAVGPFFALDAAYLATGQPAQLQPGQAYSMVVAYDPAALPSGIDEDELALFAWDAEPGAPLPSQPAWVREPTSAVNAAENTITATPDHFSLWAILAPAKIYLPVLLR